jgi:acetone carboxylase beta subunit
MEALKPGNRIVGPAIIESASTTFVVPDGFETRLDKHRLFHLKETGSKNTSHLNATSS